MKKTILIVFMVLMGFVSKSQVYEINIVPEYSFGECNTVIDGYGYFVTHSVWSDDSVRMLKTIYNSKVDNYQSMMDSLVGYLENTVNESKFMYFAVFVKVSDSIGVVYEYDKHYCKGGEKFVIDDVGKYVNIGVKAHEYSLRYYRSIVYGGDLVSVYVDVEGNGYYWNDKENVFSKIE